MGVSLKTMPYATFFEILFSVKAKPAGSYYYKDVQSILSHPYCNMMVSADATLAQIKKENITHSTQEYLQSISDPKDHEILQLLFQDWGLDSGMAISCCNNLLERVSLAQSKFYRRGLCISTCKIYFLKLPLLMILIAT